MKRRMTSRMLLGAALLIAGVGVAAAQGIQAGGEQRSETKAQATAHKSGAQKSQAQVQHKQSGAIHANGASQRTAAHTATRNVKTERAKVAHAKSPNQPAHKAAMHAQTNKATTRAQHTAQKAKPAADVKARTAAQNNTRVRSTTGQGSADMKANSETRAQARPGRATITAQQQTRLRTVVTARNVPHVRRANFALRTGILVPRSVRFARVAAFPVLIDVFPDYRPYSFFVVQNEVVFVDSGRHIVDVVPLEGGMASAQGGGAMAMETDLAPEEIREVQTVLVAEGFPLEVTGVWDVRTRDALIVFQRRHGFAATGFIDARTVTALKLNGKISQSHIRGANRAIKGNARQAIDNPKGGLQRGESNARNGQPRQERSTTGQGGKEQMKPGRNEPKAGNEPKTGNKTDNKTGNMTGNKAGNEPKAGNEGGQSAQPRAEQKPRSTTGAGENKMKESEPNRPNQNKY